MLNKLFKRLAPLVAGILVAHTAVFAAYPYIAIISRSGNDVTVGVATGGSVPPGHVEPRAQNDNYYWWTNQVHNSTYNHSTTIDVKSSAVTNAAVYVYPNDGSGNYSYAIHNTVTGVTIWNGP